VPLQYKNATHKPPAGTKCTQLADIILAQPQAITPFKSLQRGRYLKGLS
jgi:hypothetical protein